MSKPATLEPVSEIIFSQGNKQRDAQDRLLLKYRLLHPSSNTLRYHRSVSDVHVSRPKLPKSS